MTPDGVYRVANKCQNKDLFRALRGGSGSLGVVLESTSRAIRKTPLQVYVAFTTVRVAVADQA